MGRHPGHDCFVVPRLLVPAALRAGGLAVGMPPWGTMYHYAIQRDPNLNLLFLQVGGQGWGGARWSFSECDTCPL